MPNLSPSHPVQATHDDDHNSYQSMWDTVKKALIEELNNETYRTWIDALMFVQFEANMVTLSAPTRFARDWIKNNLQRQLLHFWKQEQKNIIGVNLIVGRKKEKASPIVQNFTPAAQVKTANKSPLLKKTLLDEEDQKENSLLSQTLISQENLSDKKAETKVDVTKEATIPPYQQDLYFDEKYTFENFIVGPSNELAFAAARKIATGESVTFNPLFFHSGVGLGKTHLMHAIALYMKEHQQHRSVVYLSAEQFMYRFVNALRNHNMQAFKEEFRSVDTLLIDDLQFISGKNSTQEEFFHTFNALVDNKKQIVLSADRSPNDMNNMEERIKSRLGWGLVVDIHQTDYSLRIGIIESKIKLLQQEYPSFFVPDKVIEYLAHYITGNVRELEGAINRIAAFATFTGSPVTLESVEDAVADLLRMYEKKIGISEIQKKICEYFNIRLEDMKSARRSRDISRPRQIAMYLAKNMTRHSFPEIGRQFGGKDHTTVLHGVKRVEELIAEDNDFSDLINTLKTHVKTQ